MGIPVIVRSPMRGSVSTRCRVTTFLGVTLLSLSASFAAAGALWLAGPSAGVAAWFAVAYGWIGLGYLKLGAMVFGKNSRGNRAFWAWCVLLPFLLPWRPIRKTVAWLGGEDCFNRVAPGIYVGRMCSLRELPADTALVVDLTAEFLEARGIRKRFAYRCLPTLDRGVPSAPSLACLVQELSSFDGPLYIHCAAGHGRSAMVAAAVLVARGMTRNIEEAIAHMKRSRPRIRLTELQKHTAEQALSGLPRAQFASVA